MHAQPAVHLIDVFHRLFPQEPHAATATERGLMGAGRALASDLNRAAFVLHVALAFAAHAVLPALVGKTRVKATGAPAHVEPRGGERARRGAIDAGCFACEIHDAHAWPPMQFPCVT